MKIHKTVASAVALLLSALMLGSCSLFSFKSRLKAGLSATEPTTSDYEYTPATEQTSYQPYEPPVTDVTSAYEEPSSSEPSSEAPSYEPSSAEQVTQPQNTGPDYGSMSKTQVAAVYAEALNKTRAVTSTYEVHHSEIMSFQCEELSINNDLVKRFVNLLMEKIIKPSDETLKFSGGRATNSEGESVPVLLPQRTSFSLPESGIASAYASKEGDGVHVVITLAPESVGFGQTPQYNSAAVGYLDTASLSLPSIISINKCTITYTGSVIDCYIGTDGYIDKCTYTINMKTVGEASGLGITGSGTIVGSQTEIWEIGL